MSDLEKRFTPLQAQKLRAAGVKTIYDFLTYLPLGVRKVVPVTTTIISEEPVKYMDQAILENINHRKGKQHFLQLQWQSTLNGRVYQTYLFSVARFTIQSLRQGDEYQLLLTNRNGFWNLEKYTKLGQIELAPNLRLGHSKIGEYLEVYYPKMGVLPGNYVKSLHLRLKPEDYKLNLLGLVAPNPLVPEEIDLSRVHKPVRSEDYQQGIHQWLSFQIYLKLALAKYVDNEQKQQFGRGSRIDVDFLKYLTGNLPFKLSSSQKLAIWDILQGVSLEKEV